MVSSVLLSLVASCFNRNLLLVTILLAYVVVEDSETLLSFVYCLSITVTQSLVLLDMTGIRTISDKDNNVLKNMQEIIFTTIGRSSVCQQNIKLQKVKESFLSNQGIWTMDS